MKFLSKGFLFAVLLGSTAVCSAGVYVQSVTIERLQLVDASMGNPAKATAYVRLQNNQTISDCYLSSIHLSDLNTEFQKQAYATLLTAKINQLVLSQLAYRVVTPYMCELEVVEL